MEGSVPLSFPAVLVNPKGNLNNATRRTPLAEKATPPKASSSVLMPTGKRSRRRWSNNHFENNPAIRLPSKADLSPRPPPAQPLFVPTPSTFSRSLIVPSVPTPPSNPTSALSPGNFHLTLRGLKRQLRSSLPSSPIATFLHTAEQALNTWLSSTSASAFSSVPRILLRDALTAEPSLVELARQPHTVRWVVDDPYQRWLVHCLARYYSLGSFSAPLPGGAEGERVTHLVRNQIAKPRVPPSGPAMGMGIGGFGLDTPPGTDLSASEFESLAGDEDGASESDWERVEAIPETSSDFSDVEDPSEVTPRKGSAPVLDLTPTASRPEERRTRASFPPSSASRLARNTTHDESGESVSRESSVGAPLVRPTREKLYGVRDGEWKMPEKSFVDFLSE